MPFKKGHDPNRNTDGRPPKGKSWADVINRILKETVVVNGTEMEKKEAITRKLVAEAANGEQWAINALMDRTDGKPKQIVDQTTRSVNISIDGEDAEAYT